MNPIILPFLYVLAAWQVWNRGHTFVMVLTFLGGLGLGLYL